MKKFFKGTVDLLLQPLYCLPFSEVYYVISVANYKVLKICQFETAKISALTNQFWV